MRLITENVLERKHVNWLWTSGGSRWKENMSRNLRVLFYYPIHLNGINLEASRQIYDSSRVSKIFQKFF